MTNLIKWTRPRGAVHDLMHLLSLSDQRTFLVCLSEQELYILQNWMALDLEFESRYAVVMQHDGYEPLDRDHSLWAAWRSIINIFQTEVRDMSCDLLAVLIEIRDELAANRAAVEAISTAITNKVIPDHDYTSLLDSIGDGIGAITIPNPNWAALLADLAGTITVDGLPVPPNWTDLVESISTPLLDLADPETDWPTLVGNIVTGLQQIAAPEPPVFVQTTVQGSDICCPPLSDLAPKDVAPLEEPPEQGEFWCEICRSYALDFTDQANYLLHRLTATNTVTMSILALWMTKLLPSLAGILEVFGFVGGQVVEVISDDLDTYFADLADAFTCALYNASTPETGRTALYAAIDSGPYPENWPTFGGLALKAMVNFAALNKVYDQTWEIRADATTFECGECLP